MSCKCMYASPLPLEPASHPPSLPARSSQSNRLSSLCYTVSPHELSILHMVVCVFQCYSHNSFHPFLPPIMPF